MRRAGAESRGNYDAWYGNARQDEVVLADLTLDEVRALQGDLIRANGGSAFGRYQIIAGTLESLTERLGLSGEERFTPVLQDRLALQLAEDAGMPAWLDGRLSDERFAENLARTWAGLPSDGSGTSYYAGIQSNRATVAWDSVLAALADIRRGRDS